MESRDTRRWLEEEREIRKSIGFWILLFGKGAFDWLSEGFGCIGSV